MRLLDPLLNQESELGNLDSTDIGRVGIKLQASKVIQLKKQLLSNDF